MTRWAIYLWQKQQTAEKKKTEAYFCSLEKNTLEYSFPSSYA